MAPLQDMVVATRTILDAPSRVLPRQAPATVTIVTTERVYQDQLSPGAIAGIVIGSIVGFLIIMWMVRWACMQSSVPDEKPSYYHQEAAVSPRRRRHDHHHHHHDHHRHHHSRSRSRGPDVRVVTSHTTAHPGGYIEPIEPTRTYYEKRRSRSRY